MGFQPWFYMLTLQGAVKFTFNFQKQLLTGMKVQSLGPISVDPVIKGQDAMSHAYAGR